MIHPGATTRTPRNKCLNCGFWTEAASTPDGSAGAPTEGSLSVCIKCGAVMMFDQDLRLRGMTASEMDSLLADHELMGTLAKLVRCINFIRHRTN